MRSRLIGAATQALTSLRPGVSVEKIFPRLGETDTTDNVSKLLKEARC
jgi:hypothetical protein